MSHGRRVVTGFEDSSSDEDLTRAPNSAASAGRPASAAGATTPTTTPTTAANNDWMAARRAAVAQQGAGALRAANLAPSTPTTTAAAAAAANPTQQQRPPLPTAQFNQDQQQQPAAPTHTTRSESPPQPHNQQFTPQPQQQQQQASPASSPAQQQQAQQQPTTQTTAAQIEELRRLRSQVTSKQNGLQTSKQREAELESQLRRARSEHEQRITLIEQEARKIRQEADDERAKQHEALDKATREHDQFLRDERVRLETELSSNSNDAELTQLEQEVTTLREQKKSLQAQLTHINSTGSEIDKLLTDAVSRVLGHMNTAFEEKFKADESFVGNLRELIRGEVKTSFTSKAQEEELDERTAHSKDFEETLAQWKQAEEQERYHVLRQDEQLLADLNSIAHEALDQIQKEELALQQSFLAQREQWMRSHRAALQAEMEASLQRRAVEFDEIRTLRREAFAQKLKDLEEQHLADMQRDREVYEAKMDSIRSTAQMRQKLQEQRVKLVKDVQREAENAVGELRDTLMSVSGAVDRVDEYRKTVEEARTLVVRDQERTLAERQQMLKEAQQILSEQMEHVDKERRLLAEGSAKLESVHQILQRQLAEERQWANETHSRVERSRAEWEREYRKWQQVAAAERRAAEQRFSDAIRELNGLTASLDDETHAVEAELEQLHRRADERTRSVAAEMEALAQREQQTQKRTEAVAQVVGDLEQRSRQLTAEWQRLQAQKHELLAQRRELEQEEGRMLALGEQLHVMRGQAVTLQADAATAQERKKNIDANVAAAREMMAAQGEALRADRTRRSQSHHAGNNNHHQLYTRLTVPRGDMAGVDRLPSRLLSELQEMVGGSAGQQQTHQQQQQAAPRQQTYQQPQQQPHHSARHDRVMSQAAATSRDRVVRAAKVDNLLARHGMALPGGGASPAADRTAGSVSFTPLVNMSDASGAS